MLSINKKLFSFHNKWLPIITTSHTQSNNSFLNSSKYLLKNNYRFYSENNSVKSNFIQKEKAPSQIEKDITAINQKLNSFENKVENKFGALENKFDALENKVDALENKVDARESKFKQTILLFGLIIPILTTVIVHLIIQWYEERKKFNNRIPLRKLPTTFIQTKAYKELLKIVKKNRQCQNVVYVIGPSGSGKSTIINKVIEDVYPEIEVIELDCEKLEESKKKYLNSKNVIFSDESNDVDIKFESHLLNKHTILVLQNYTQEDQKSNKLIALTNIVFLEMQSVEKINIIDSVYLDGFSYKEAKQLLSHLCSDKSTFDDNTLKDLLKEIGNLPLDLWLAGTTMEEFSWKAETYLSKFKKMETLHLPKSQKIDRRRYIELQLLYDNLTSDQKLDLLTLSCFEKSEYIPNEWMSISSILNSTALKSHEDVFILNPSIYVPLRYIFNQCKDKEAVLLKALDKLTSYKDDKLSVQLSQHIDCFANVLTSLDLSAEFKEKVRLELRNVQLNLDIKNGAHLDSKDLLSHLQKVEQVFGNSSEAYYFTLSVILSWRVKYFKVDERIPISNIIRDSVIYDVLSKNEKLSNSESFVISMYANDIRSQQPSLYNEIENHLFKYGDDEEKARWYHNKGFDYLRNYLINPNNQDPSILQNAEKWLKCSLDIRKSFEKKHKIYIANASLLLGKVLMLQNKINEAETVLNEACNAYVEAFGVNPLKAPFSSKYKHSLDAFYYKSLLHPFINFMIIYSLYHIDKLDKREARIEALKERVLHSKSIPQIVQKLK